MAFCKAFDSRQNPCLNPGDLCQDHLDFYDTWFQRYPLADNDYFFSSSEKVKKVYTTAILENRVKITREHFEDLVNTGKPIESLVDYYLLCCLQKDVDPLWNMALFNQTCKEIVLCHTKPVYSLVQKDKHFLYRFLDPLFNSSRSFDTILYYILWNITSWEHIWKSSHDVPIYLDNPEVSLIQYIKAHPRFSSEFIWKDSIQHENMMNLISKKITGMGSTSKLVMKFLETVPDLRAEEKLKRKKVFQERANEIISVAWAPQRVRKWCMSIDDGLDQRWL